MVKIIDCNLFDSGAEVLLQQVNCKGSMSGSGGVAKQVRDRFPQVNEAYKKYCKTSSYDPAQLLGTVLDVAVEGKDGKQTVISCMFGQNNYGSGFCYTDYPALHKALEIVKERHGAKRIALPYRMSCSLAGGEWRVVEELVLDVLGSCDVTICRYKGSE